jgi:hypothetical protein
MPDTCHFYVHSEKSCLKMSDSEWVEHINLKNFRYGLIPKPKAKESMAEPFPMKDQYAEAEKFKRNLERKRPMPAVRAIVKNMFRLSRSRGDFLRSCNHPTLMEP